MPHEYHRTDRVADQIQKRLAELIQREVKDPRVSSLVTITEVKVSREFDHATVYFTVLGKEEDAENTLEGLNKAAGYLRSALARQMKLRSTPKLNFVYDTSIEDGNRLSSLIESAISDDDRQDTAQ